MSGCSPGAGAVEIAPVSAPAAAVGPCRSLLGALPESVASQSSRPVRSSGVSNVSGAAWGSPPVVLRCGVARPAALTASSSCMEVNDVGWFAEKRSPGYVFTTIGRAVNVELTVPSAYAPESNALVDVAAAVKKHIPSHAPCL